MDKLDKTRGEWTKMVQSARLQSCPSVTTAVGASAVI